MAATRLRIAALGGFGPSQARPQQALLDGAALVALVEASVAAWAALDLQLTPAGVAHVALQWVWPKLWLDPQQTLGEVAPLAMVASVAAALAA